MSQLALRITIPDRGPGLRIVAKCDYCEKAAQVRMLGNDMVCDRCLGVVAGEGESELEAVRR